MSGSSVNFICPAQSWMISASSSLHVRKKKVRWRKKKPNSIPGHTRIVFTSRFLATGTFHPESEVKPVNTTRVLFTPIAHPALSTLPNTAEFSCASGAIHSPVAIIHPFKGSVQCVQ